MRFVILCGLIVQMALFSYDHKPSLRTLIVYDSLTPNVQAAAVADAARVKEALEFAAGQAGLVFRPKILTASNLNKKTFQKWLKTIHPSSGDTAFFYYAGRGSNHPHKKWPFIPFGTKKQTSEKTVLRHINSRKPNLAAVVFDCYNKPITNQSGVDFSKIRKLDISRYGPMLGFKNLFRNYKGWIMWSSGQSAFYSSRQPPIGGLFTSNFLRGFFGFSKSPHVGWTNVSCITRSLCCDTNLKPPPVFVCHFKKIPDTGIR